MLHKMSNSWMIKVSTSGLQQLWVAPASGYWPVCLRPGTAATCRWSPCGYSNPFLPSDCWPWALWLTFTGICYSYADRCPSTCLAEDWAVTCHMTLEMMSCSGPKVPWITWIPTSLEGLLGCGACLQALERLPWGLWMPGTSVTPIHRPDNNF